MLEHISAFEVERILKSALAEDVGSGDVTSPFHRSARADDLGAIHRQGKTAFSAGWRSCARAFALLDASIAFTALAADGDRVRKGDVIATVSGDARAILAGERVGLNLLQHMSGVATQTARAVAAVAGTGAKIVDTRKTTPGLRVLGQIRRAHGWRAATIASISPTACSSRTTTSSPPVHRRGCGRRQSARAALPEDRSGGRDARTAARGAGGWRGHHHAGQHAHGNDAPKRFASWRDGR